MGLFSTFHIVSIICSLWLKRANRSEVKLADRYCGSSRMHSGARRCRNCCSLCLPARLSLKVCYVYPLYSDSLVQGSVVQAKTFVVDLHPSPLLILVPSAQATVLLECQASSLPKSLCNFELWNCWHCKL